MSVLSVHDSYAYASTLFEPDASRCANASAFCSDGIMCACPISCARPELRKESRTCVRMCVINVAPAHATREETAIGGGDL